MSLFSTAGLARISARRPWIVLALWLLLAVAAGFAQGGLSSALDGEDELTNNPESQRGASLLEERLRGPEPATETVIIRSDGLTVDDPAFRAEVEQTVAALRGSPEAVASAQSYYDAVAAGDPAAEQLVSADRRTTIVPVTLAGEYDTIDDLAEDYVDLVAGLGSDQVQVMSVGDASFEVEYGKIVEEDLARGETLGIAVALVVLVVVFGALIAAGLPIILALVSIFVTLGLVALIGQAWPMTDVVLNIVTMIGLAVGIDYALFVVERYREERRAGLEKRDAIERAGATASKAVVVSGLTVVIALMGMFLIPVSVFRNLGVGAALVVLVAVAANLTLVPALLSLLGDKVNWPRRAVSRQPSAVSPPNSGLRTQDSGLGFWGRITRLVMARPAISALLAIGILVAAAFPVRDLTTGQAGIDTLPEGDVKFAYTVLATDFYAGMVAPVEIVIDGPAADPAIDAAVADLTAALATDGRYGPATVETNDTGDLTLVSVPLTLEPNSPDAETAVEELRADLIPEAFAETDASVHVTGDAAFSADFNAVLEDSTPVVFAFVLGLSFLLLLLAFRSIVVPLKAIVLNLLSVGAAYGLLVLVFQKGVGNELFGFQQTPAITAWLPLFLFSILFGLSMDYHVFLLSRIREHFDLTHRNGESVAVGLHATAKIITGAALIMVAVFGGFASGRLVDFQQMGFGLAAAVLIDATLVRSVLVPASMTLLGDRNWYLPRWLGWLPDLRIEGTPRLAPAGATAGLGGSAPAGLPAAQRRLVTPSSVATAAAVTAGGFDSAGRSNAEATPAQSTSADRGVLRAVADFVLVPFDGRTYRSVGYLLLGFPLGLAYFMFVTIGFALGFGLLMMVVGIPILFLTLAGVRRLMRFERRLAAGVLDEPVPAPAVAVQDDANRWVRLRRRMTDRRTYAGAAFLVAKLPVGIADLVLTVFALSLPLALLSALVTFPFDGANDRFGGWEIDTVQEAALSAALAPLVGLLALHALIRLARFQARLARRAFDDGATAEA